MKKICIALAIVGLGACATAFPQSADREGSWEGRFGATFKNSTDYSFKGGTTAALDSSTGVLFGLGIHYTDNIEFGVNFTTDSQDYDARIASADRPGTFLGVKGELDSMSLMVDATYNFLAGPLTPFVTGAVGWNWTDTNIATQLPQTGCWWDPWYGQICTSWQNTRTIDGFAYQIGAGLRYDFSDTFAVHASYRVSWTDFENSEGSPEQDGFLLSVGWKF